MLVIKFSETPFNVCNRYIVICEWTHFAGERESAIFEVSCLTKKFVCSEEIKLMPVFAAPFSSAAGAKLG